jgi:hypothetical protein
MRKSHLVKGSPTPFLGLHKLVVIFAAVVVASASVETLSADGIWTSLNGPPGGSPVSCGALDTNGETPTLYVGTWGAGVFRWDGTSWTPMNNELPDLHVGSLALDTQSDPPSVYVGVGWTYKWDGTQWVDMSMGGHCGVNALIVDVQTIPATLYAGTECGVRRWNGSKWAAMDEGLNGKTILSFAIDTSTKPSTVYAGSYGAGIFKSTGHKWTSVGGGSHSEVVTGIAVDHYGSEPILYAGTESHGVFQRYKRDWTGINRDLTCDGGISTFAIASDGWRSTVYCGSDQGVFQWNGGTWAPLNEGLPQRGVAVLGIDQRRSPGVLFAGTSQGVYSLDVAAPSITPPLITGVRALKDPFRLEITGAYFHPSAVVLIDDNPVPATTYKDGSTLVASGGADLKGLMPSTNYFMITVVNRDDSGVSNAYGFGRY